MRAFILDWSSAAADLLVGVLKRVWVWVIPLVVLQPIDLVDKLRIPLAIPDSVAYGLVGLGLAVSVVDVIRERRGRIRQMERAADARRVAGSVHMNPALYPVDEYRLPDGQVVGLTLTPMIQLNNQSDGPVKYRVQRFEALIEGAVHRQDHVTSSFPIPKGEYMVISGLGEFGPYPIGSAVDSVIVLEVRLSLPFSESTVVEQRQFEFRSIVHHAKDRMGARTELFSPTPGPEKLVEASIEDDTAHWQPDRPFTPLEPTPGPHTGIFEVPEGEKPDPTVLGLPADTVMHLDDHEPPGDDGDGHGKNMGAEDEWETGK